ncbi:MAG: lipid A deacylase LpxR family protein [Bdellovibrionales bacterium]|nr:lipid A deacylase LpxR family protein [Bdellovibrionales bacterium]
MPLKLKTKSIRILTLLLGVFYVSVTPSFAESKSPSTPESIFTGGHQPAFSHGEAFALYIENDTRNIGGPGSDEAYSNGLKLSYIYAEDRIPPWSRAAARSMAFLGPHLDRAKLNYAFSVGPQIYTPNNTQEGALIKDDRPYVGWLYLGFTVSLRQENVGHFLELDLGTLGPSALGSEVQNSTHNLIGAKKAQGWRNSLNDEPTLQLFYQKRTKTDISKQLDFIPSYGAALGNVQVSAQIGAQIRFGFNLPDDFGPGRPSAGDGDPFVSPMQDILKKRNSYYIFGGGRGNWIARNIFLDGNSFRESPRVTKHPVTFSTEFGFGLQFTSLALVWRFVTRSPEFEEKKAFNSFASVSVIYFVH